MTTGADSNQKNYYEKLPVLIPGKEYQFMNHGYAHIRKKDKISWLARKDRSHIYNVQLLVQLVNGLDLTGKRVLDIGCGRGGNSSVLARYFMPKEVIGIDYSKNGIQLCKRIHRSPNLKFKHDNAMSLSFKNMNFDVVINVESSHCYPNVVTFYKEVFRVLVPGGNFRYTDIMHKSMIGDVTKALRETGFVIKGRTDITANVVLALKRGRQILKQNLLSAAPTGKGKRAAMELFDQIEGPLFEAYSSRSARYVIWELKRPDSK